MRWIVVVKVAQRSAQGNRIRAKLFFSLSDLGKMRDANLGFSHKPQHVVAYVVERESGDFAVVLQIGLEMFPPLFNSHVGDVSLVAQEIVNDEDARRLDTFFDRLVPAECALVEGEWERLCFVYRDVFVKQYLFRHLQIYDCSASASSAPLFRILIKLWNGCSRSCLFYLALHIID